MEANSKEYLIYKNIDFAKRYEALSEINQFDKTFEDYSSDEVINTITQLGYKSKFVKRENFFRTVEEESGLKFYFHISLKYGVVEIIIGATNIKTNKFLFGGPFGAIFNDIFFLEYKKDKRIKLPKFRDYNDLETILKEAFSIYEDFKKEIITQEK